MSKEKLSDAIDSIGIGQLERYNNTKEKLKTKKRATLRARRGLLIAAACLLLAAVMLPAGFLIARGRTGPYNPPDGTDAGTVAAGDRVAGIQGTEWGSAVQSGAMAAERLPPYFQIQTVLEVRLLEVLPDCYTTRTGARYDDYVAKFEVLDQVTGDGFPPVIYLRYRAVNYAGTRDGHFFDGYDSFLISVTQTGTDGYLMINTGKQRYEYFPNMFTVYNGDVTYAGIIAFTDGKADGSFFERCSNPGYMLSVFNGTVESSEAYYGDIPARKGDSLADVKATIRKLAKNPQRTGWFYGGYNELFIAPANNYVSAADIITGDEERAVWDYVCSDGNYFIQELSVYSYSVDLGFIRNINGFPANEYISIRRVTDGSGTASTVTKRGARFTAADLAAMPDIASVISGLDLKTLEAPHTTVGGLTRRYVTASGRYVKAGDSIMGLVSIDWWFTDEADKAGGSGKAYCDDMFLLIDGSDGGNCREVSRAELAELLGDDAPSRAWYEYNVGFYLPQA